MSFRTLSEAEFDTILNGEGHQPCPGVEIQFDVELCPATEDAPRQFATIYRPVGGGVSSTPSPGLLAFHGGGFCQGTPDGCGVIAKALALSLGVVTVSASYRLGSAGNPATPAILNDAARAWRWIRAHAGQLGIAPDRIAVSGESAGCLFSGHLAVRSPWLAINRPDPASDCPSAFIALWGPLDFVARWYDNGENPGAETNILGPGGYAQNPALYHQLSVLAHAHRAPLPPAFFASGRFDQVVHPRQGALGLAAWNQAGAYAERWVIPGIGHGTTGDTRPQRRQLLEKLLDFAAAHWAG
ncbi:MAG: alpha/beta hydrolase [Opitutaceae bacterium]|jgi:acetyl esterase/lipase|nr:alpha/beta hydrolase [Opitutaceae bacterium]